jgi:hypothetical protein
VFSADIIIDVSNNDSSFLDGLVKVLGGLAAIATIVGVTVAVRSYRKSLADTRKEQARLVWAIFTPASAGRKALTLIAPGDTVTNIRIDTVPPDEVTDFAEPVEGTGTPTLWKQYTSKKPAIGYQVTIVNNSDEVVTHIRYGISYKNVLLGRPAVEGFLLPGKESFVSTVAEWSTLRDFALIRPVIIFRDAAGHTWQRAIDEPVKLLAKAGTEPHLSEKWRWQW